MPFKNCHDSHFLQDRAHLSEHLTRHGLPVPRQNRNDFVSQVRLSAEGAECFLFAGQNRAFPSRPTEA